MRISPNDITGIITPTTHAVKPTNTKNTKKYGRDIARRNELGVCIAIAKYGHLRVAEIARIVWPDAKWSEQMAQRTCRRLTAAGRILARRNALGGVSYVLTRPGAGWLSLQGYEARHTLELSSVGGATFIHRTIATRYLVERSLRGAAVAGEYEMKGNRLPFSSTRLERALKKLPDGLAWRRDYAGNLMVEWVEVENAAKPKSEILKLLSVAAYTGQAIDSSKNAFLAGLIVVFDGTLNHAQRLMKSANELWGKLPREQRERYEKAVTLVSVDLRSTLVWLQSTSVTLHEFRRQIK